MFSYGALKSGEDCTLAYIIPKVVTGANATLVAGGHDVDNNPTTLSMTISALGHFVFKGSDGKTTLTSLAVKGGDTGTIHLENTGGMTIGNVQVSIPEAVSPYFKGACLDTSALLVGTSCTLTYNIPKVVTKAKAMLEASGSDVDNNSTTLPMTVSALGHFVFKGSDGKTTLTSLAVKGGDTGTIHLENTGGLTIGNIRISVPEAIKTYFKGSCFDITTLAVGASCSLSYSLPLDYVNKVDDKISVQGIDVDNTSAFINFSASPKPLVYENMGLSLRTNMAPNPNALDKWGVATITLNFNRKVITDEFKLVSANLYSLHYGDNPDAGFDYKVTQIKDRQVIMTYRINKDNYAPGCTYIYIKYKINDGSTLQVNTPNFNLIAPGGENGYVC